MHVITRSALALAAAYMRRLPVKQGRWRLIDYFLPRLRAKGSMLGERVVRTRYGFFYKADLGDWLGQYVYLTGCYEPPTARVIADRLRPGDIFVDVGANSGFFTLLASIRVGAAGKVWAFEPVSSMRGRLQTNLTLNGIHNVVVHDVAVSNASGECVFHEGPSGHKGVSSLRAIDNEAKSFTVTTRPLDEIIPETSTVKLIKIDVEGAEQLVVEGMRRLVARQRPDIIIEVTDQYLAAFGHRAETLCRSLCDMGYAMYRIEEDHLVRMQPAEAHAIPQYNALFTHAQPLGPQR